jgi:hypothetical protein
MAGVGSCGYSGVNVSGRGARAVSPGAHCKPAEERFKEEGKEEGIEGVPLQGTTIDVYGWGGAIRKVMCSVEETP